MGCHCGTFGARLPGTVRIVQAIENLSSLLSSCGTAGRAPGGWRPNTTKKPGDLLASITSLEGELTEMREKEIVENCTSHDESRTSEIRFITIDDLYNMYSFFNNTYIISTKKNSIPAFLLQTLPCVPHHLSMLDYPKIFLSRKSMRLESLTKRVIHSHESSMDFNDFSNILAGFYWFHLSIRKPIQRFFAECNSVNPSKFIFQKWFWVFHPSQDFPKGNF